MMSIWIEKWLYDGWQHFYFQFGVPIYISGVTIPAHNLPVNNALVKDGERSEIKNIAQNLYYFKLGTYKPITLGIRYAPARGYIVFNERTHKHRCIFFINWHLLMLLLMVLYVAIDTSQEIKCLWIGLAMIAPMVYLMNKFLNKLCRSSML